MSNVEDIANRTAAGIALAYRSGEASPVDLTECLLERIASAKSENIFISINPVRARQEAKKAKGRYEVGAPLSPLDGVPIGWKDLFDVAGSPTTAGSTLFGSSPAKTDLPCVANAAAAGLVSVGKLNMTELAYSGLGLNPHFGTPLNPNDRKTPRSPGGSSSGSGASVAARLLPCAIGSDTGGSVRIPAAFNGVVGYKTSTGRIDTSGLMPLARTYDTIGPLARSVEDCILLDMVLRGAVMTPVRRGELSSLTLIAPRNVVLDDADEAVVENFERSLEGLAKAGVAVRRERFDTLDEIVEMNARYGTLTAAEAYNEYRDIVDSDKVKMVDRRVVKRIVDGKHMTANDLLSIQRGRRKLIDKFHGQLGSALLAMPTTPITAPEVMQLEASDATFHAVNIKALRNTMLGNILDLCGVALPNGRDAGNLPTSLLVSAGHNDDDRLLGYALEIERVVRDASGWQ